MLSFVGAGPGDIELLTVKGQRRLEQAEVVIYDRLVNPLLLFHCPKECQFVYVGKTPYQPSMKQLKINELLKELPQKYQNVVRLKGGDPLIFGRLTEELEAAKQAGHQFEIVPGVTAASGSAAYCGLSLTMRGTARGVTFLTGFLQENQLNPLIELPKEQTLCLYMGMEALKTLLPKLKKQSAWAKMKLAIIEWGTWGCQKSIFGSIATIEDKLKKQPLQNPAMILIGKTIHPENSYPWYQQLPQFNQSILLVATQKPTLEQLTAYTSQGADIWWHQVGPQRDERFDLISQRVRSERNFMTIEFIDPPARKFFEEKKLI